jgi:hypothetical protein
MLFIVEDTFWIKGRGLILVPGLSAQRDEVIRIGDPLLLTRPDGSTIVSQIRGIEMIIGTNRRDGIPILVADLCKDHVPIGTKVWSVDEIRYPVIPTSETMSE